MSVATKFAFTASELVTSDKMNAVSKAQGRVLIYDATPQGQEFVATTLSPITLTLNLHNARTKRLLFMFNMVTTPHDLELFVNGVSIFHFNGSDPVGLYAWPYDIEAADEVGSVDFPIELRIGFGADATVKDIIVAGLDDDTIPPGWS